MTLSLKVLLEHTEFGLKLLSGDKGAEKRLVCGAHVLEEIDEPLAWVPEGWIMLTTGLRLRRAAEQRRLVAALADGGVCALGFGTGFGFGSVPAALVAEADRRDFPVFAVPKLTPFREIVRHVDTALVTSELHVMRRVLSMHGYLLEALGQLEPEHALVARLAQLLSSEAALFRHDGRVVAATRPDRTVRWWRTLAEAVSADPPSRIVEVESLLAARATPARGPHSWIVVVGSHENGRALARRLVESTLPMLSALCNAREHSALEDQAMRAGLLDELLRCIGHERTLHRRALAYGVDLARPIRAAVFDPAPEREKHAAIAPLHLADVLARALDRDGIPNLVGPRAHVVAALVPGDADLGRILAELRSGSLRVACGIGRAVTGASNLRLGLRDAEIALKRARRDDCCGVARYEDIDLASWLLLEAGDSVVRDKAIELLSPISDRPDLEATLSAYLLHAMDVPRTARHLHVHQNSLRYRLSRIEQLLGRNLHDAGDLAAIHIALLVTSGDDAPAPASKSASSD